MLRGNLGIATDVLAELHKLGTKLRDFFLHRGKTGGSALAGPASPEQRLASHKQRALSRKLQSVFQRVPARTLV